MDSKEKLRLAIGEMLAEQPLAVLATQGEEGPYASLIGFAATDDLRFIIFATPRPTRKYANLIAEPRVAFLIDNRSNDEADFHQAAAVTIRAKAEEVPPEEREKTLEIFLAKHPHLADFTASPTTALFRAKVDTCYLVTRFQEVVELRINP